MVLAVATVESTYWKFSYIRFCFPSEHTFATVCSDSKSIPFVLGNQRCPSTKDYLHNDCICSTMPTRMEKDMQTNYFNEEEDEKETQSMLELLLHGARRTFRENLPLDIIKQLQGRYLVILGLIGYGITFALFVLFFVVGFLQRINETYISTDPNAGLCVEVGRALTGTFLASTAGIWEGSEGFSYHDAMYSFRFTDLVVTSDEFRTMITKGFDLSPLKNFMGSHDLPSNLIAYTNFVDVVTVKGKAQTMSLTTKPDDVFNRNYRSGYVYNVNASYCYADGILYDGSSTSYAFLFGKKVNNDNCVHLTNYIVNYDSKIISNFGIFRMDLNTFAAAMAVNLKMLSLDQFEVVEDKGIINLGGILLQTTRVHNPRFPKMGPLACIQAVNAPNVTWSPFCAIVQNDKVFMPALYHFQKACRGCANARAVVQSQLNKMERETVSNTPAGEYGGSRLSELASSSDDYAACNVIDLVAALVYAPISPLEASYAELMKFVVTFTQTEINDIVADSAAVDGTPKLLFQICPLCTVISVNLYDNSMIIGQYGQTLSKGHCAASLNSTNFYKLGESPPQQLVENYFECTDTMFGAFFYAIGFAFGNTGTFAPLMLMTLVPIVFLLLGCWGSKVPFEHYSEEVTQDATKELVRLLLKIKDGKMENIPPNGVLATFVEEVKDAHKSIERRRSISGKKGSKKFLLSSPSMYNISKPSTPGTGTEIEKEGDQEAGMSSPLKSSHSRYSPQRRSQKHTPKGDQRAPARDELMNTAGDSDPDEDLGLGGDIEAFDYAHRFAGATGSTGAGNHRGYSGGFGASGTSSKHRGHHNSLLGRPSDADADSDGEIIDLDLQPADRGSVANLPQPMNHSRDEGEEEAEAACPTTPLAIRAVHLDLEGDLEGDPEL